MFSVLNSSSRTIELLPPKYSLLENRKDQHSKTIKAEPVAIKDYRLTARRLAPGARADGVVIFERPSFRQAVEASSQPAHRGYNFGRYPDLCRAGADAKIEGVFGPIRIA